MIVGENDELELDTAVGKIVGISVGVVVGGSVGSRVDDECGVCQFLLSTGGSAQGPLSAMAVALNPRYTSQSKMHFEIAMG